MLPLSFSRNFSNSKGVQSNFRLIPARWLKRTFNEFPRIVGSCSGLHSFTRTSISDDRSGHERLTFAIFRDSWELRNGASFPGCPRESREKLSQREILRSSLDRVLLVRRGYTFIVLFHRFIAYFAIFLLPFSLCHGQVLSLTRDAFDAESRYFLSHRGTLKVVGMNFSRKGKEISMFPKNRAIANISCSAASRIYHIVTERKNK